MACPICHHHCDADNITSFGMYFRNVEENFAILPCTAVEKFSRHFRGGILKFKAHGHRYAVNVYTGHDKSIIAGADFEKFMNDFKLGRGKYVVFHMGGRMPKAYVCSLSDAFFDDEEDVVPSGSEFEEEEQPDAAHMSADEHSDVEEEEQAHPDITYSRDTNLDDDEQQRIAAILSIREDYIGSRFIHRFTPTNITNKAMKIPNKVRGTLNIGEVGVAGVRLGEGEVFIVAFKIDIDGRMVFNNQWGVFANTYNFQVGSAALFTFQMSNVNGLDVMCVVDILNI